MAVPVTVVSQDFSVVGNRRMVCATVTVAQTTDYYDVPGIKKIFSIQGTPATAIAAGVTVVGNRVSFASAASNPTQVTVVGI
jgi:hypothetical protein